jgi:DNA helicase-2/ATP-dependent DNA helicase PcrA
MNLNFRDQQARILEYRGGLMAVSAVPGSGKTHTLAALAVRLLKVRLLPDEAEILVVTFTNSAVDNIRARIRRMLADERLSDAGYRVVTLHSLAGAIIRERPDLAGTEADFRLDDELSGRNAMPEAARWFIQQEPAYWQSFLPTDLSQQRRLQIEDQWREATIRVGEEVTKLAKNLRLMPADVNRLIMQMSAGVEEQGSRGAGEQGSASAPPHLRTSAPSPFLRIGAAIYERYQAILDAGGRLDYDDLIWGAIRALENDDGFRMRLSDRWPFILEDEAQDSTPLQQHILGLLSKDHGNWVRVGDPNQAIMTTFTASDVRFFREFRQRPDVTTLPLSVSGRSAQPIIDLANSLTTWATQHHPDPIVRREALSADELIQPTAAGDPQQNPPADAARIQVQAFANEDAEVEQIAHSAARFVLNNLKRTCAILTPTNWMGQRVVAALQDIQAKHPRQIFQDQLRNTQPVRDVARVMAQVVKFCALPTNMNTLVELRAALIDLGAVASNPQTDARIKTLLRSANPERLLYPSPAAEPPLPEKVQVSEPEERELYGLAAYASKWLRASSLPVDQLLLTAAQDALVRESDLAIAHSLAVSLRRFVSVNPGTQLLDVAHELDEIASNRQRYLSNSLIESGFEPIAGVITVTTMHKAKGLEWDRVYLMSVDEVEFPHDPDGEFRGQAWYLNDHDPATEARMELEQLATPPLAPPLEGRGMGGGVVRQAHIEYIAERLRLLYVGITRAKSQLSLSYSKERFGKDNRLALAVAEIFERQ